MTDVSVSPVVRHDVETCAGGGHAASGAAAWLGLAATPTFGIMALWTGLFSGQPDMLCMQDASRLNGMALMYAVMSAFHAAPWLKLIARRRCPPGIARRTLHRCGGCRKIGGLAPDTQNVPC